MINKIMSFDTQGDIGQKRPSFLSIKDNSEKLIQNLIKSKPIDKVIVEE